MNATKNMRSKGRKWELDTRQKTKNNDGLKQIRHPISFQSQEKRYNEINNDNKKTKYYKKS